MAGWGRRAGHVGTGEGPPSSWSCSWRYKARREGWRVRKRWSYRFVIRHLFIIIYDKACIIFLMSLAVMCPSSYLFHPFPISRPGDFLGFHSRRLAGFRPCRHWYRVFGTCWPSSWKAWEAGETGEGGLCKPSWARPVDWYHLGLLVGFCGTHSARKAKFFR